MLWSIGRFDLDLTEEEFWHITPRLFATLLKRKEIGEEISDLRIALLRMTITNMSGRYAEKLTKIEDFMPHKRKEQTSEDMQNMIIALNAALGGEVILN